MHMYDVDVYDYTQTLPFYPSKHHFRQITFAIIMIGTIVGTPPSYAHIHLNQESKC